MSRGNRISPSTLRESLESCSRYGSSRTTPPAAPAMPAALPPGLLETVSDATILNYLTRFNGSRKDTAKALGMSATTLWRRLKSIKTRT